jgi:hypothetical protein
MRLGSIFRFNTNYVLLDCHLRRFAGNVLVNFMFEAYQKGLPRRSYVVDIRTKNFGCSRVMTNLFNLRILSR